MALQRNRFTVPAAPTLPPMPGPPGTETGPSPVSNEPGAPPAPLTSAPVTPPAAPPIAAPPMGTSMQGYPWPDLSSLNAGPAPLGSETPFGGGPGIKWQPPDVAAPRPPRPPMPPGAGMQGYPWPDARMR